MWLVLFCAMYKYSYLLTYKKKFSQLLLQGESLNTITQTFKGLIRINILRSSVELITGRTIFKTYKLRGRAQMRWTRCLVILAML